MNVSVFFPSHWWWEFVNWSDVDLVQRLQRTPFRHPMNVRWHCVSRWWLAAMRPFVRSIHDTFFATNAIPIRPFPCVALLNWVQHCPVPMPVPIVWPVDAMHPNDVHDRIDRNRNCRRCPKCHCPTTNRSMANWMSMHRSDSTWCWTIVTRRSETGINSNVNKWLWMKLYYRMENSLNRMTRWIKVSKPK